MTMTPTTDDAERAETVDARRARKVRWLSRLGRAALALLGPSWRFQGINRAASQRLRDHGQPVIYAVWHGQLLAALWHHRHERITLLVSEHGDGEVLVRATESLGYHSVRGSSTRRGFRALLEMAQSAAEGNTLAFTPDGPRGPAEHFAAGALVVSQRSRAPIVPMAVHASRAWRLRSWDRFLIPKPFARVTIAYGDPMVVETTTPRDAAGEAPRFEDALRQLAARAAHG